MASPGGWPRNPIEPSADDDRAGAGIERVAVGLLGATGLVGETLLGHLLGDGRYRVGWLGASDERAGRQATELFGPRAAGLPALAPLLPVPAVARDLTFVFSALPAKVAAEVEPAWARHTIVISNAAAYRADPLVPLVVPEINAAHIGPLLRRQRSERGWQGLITNPNCVVVPLVICLAPWRDLGLEAACVTTYQALSGAGRHGPSAFEATGNVLADIEGEAAKVESEPLKILGAAGRPLAGLSLAAATARVPVTNGHLLHVRVRLREKVDHAELFDRWHRLEGLTPLPECPAPLAVTERAPRPSDLACFDLTVRAGGLRRDAVLGWQFWTVADNIGRGAAGAAWLNALACEHLSF